MRDRDSVFIPVLPSFDGFFKAAKDGASKAGKESGKDFADALAAGVKRAEKQVESATGVLERSQNRAADAADKTKIAQIKLAEAMEDSSVSASKLADLTSKYEKAQRDQATADKAAEKAARKLESAKAELAKTSRQAEDAIEANAGAAGLLEGAFDGAAGKAATFAGALGGIASAGEAAAAGLEMDQALTNMENRLGASGDAAGALADEVQSVLKSGVAGGIEDAAGAIGALNSQWDNLGAGGSQTAAQLADNFLGFTQTFSVDMAEATQTAGQLITNGLAADAENAADLMTTAMQRVPDAMKNELPEIINEYGVNFAGLGYSGEEAFTMLVSQAENGKWALDKTGDALKEFQIRGSNMSKASVEAFETVKLNAEEMATAIASGGDGARDALIKTATGLLDIQDPAERANTAIALFGTPLEDLSIDKIPAFLDGLVGANDAMAGFEGSSQRVADNVANSIGGRMDALKGTAQALASQGFMRLWDTVEGFFGWVRENSEWITPIVAGVGAFAGVIGSVAAAMGLWSAATATWATVTAIATGKQAVFNSVLLANPIVRWVAILTAVGVALWAFFTKTETGRKIVETAFNAIHTAFTVLTSALSAGWEWIKTTVFDAWNATVEWVRGGWDVFTAAISAAWDWLTGALSAGWEWIKTTVFDAWNAYVENVRSNWDIVTGALSAAWDWLTGVLSAGWDFIRTTVFDAWMQTVEWIRSGWDVFTGALSAGWDWLKGVLQAGWQFISDNVFAPFKRGLGVLKSAFSVAVEAISTIWGRVRAAAARPVKFVIQSVMNNGIIAGWNKVAGWVGLDEVAPIPLGSLGGYATGGILPGYTPGKDIYTFIEPNTGMSIGLSGGEPILRPEAGRVLGSDWVDGINAAARMGGTTGVQKFLGGFASGGVIGSISDVVSRYFPMMTITSTLRPGDPGHHGSGLAVDFSNGTDTTPQMQKAAQFFYENYGPGLLELIHSPFNNNVKNGQNVGDGFGLYGAGTMNGHRNHVHIASAAPLGDPSVMVEQLAEMVGGSGSRFSRSGMVKAAWDKITGGIGEYKGLGEIAKLPAAFAKKAINAVWDFIKSKIGSAFGGSGGVAGSADSWREMAMEAMRRNGFNADDPAQVNAMLAQIQSESGGDPNIAQQIVDVNGTGESAGVGLLQIIPGTFEAYRDPELPNDRRDPWANMNAALRYYRSSYGGDLTTMWGHGHGYAHGGILDLMNHIPIKNTFDSGGLAVGEGFIPKATVKPERVLNPSNTIAFDMLPPAIQRSADAQFAVAAQIGNALSKGDFDKAGKLTNEALRDAFPNVAALVDHAAWNEWYEIANQLEFLAPITKYSDGVVSAVQKVEDSYAAQMEGAADIAEKEKALTEARENLATVEKENAEESSENADKIADAEQALADARDAGDAEAITKAEEDLQAARDKSAEDTEKAEEKRADAVAKAQEAVTAAEIDLSDARATATSLAMAAGRAEIAMAIEVASTVWNVISDIIDWISNIKIFASEMLYESMQGIREYLAVQAEQRQQVANLRMDLVNSMLDYTKSTYALRVAQNDQTAAALAGAVKTAEAEAAFIALRDAGIAGGSTSVAALGDAIDRFRENGVFSINAVSENTGTVIGQIDAAFEAFRVTGVFSIDALLAGVKNATPEIEAAAWDVAAARMTALADEQTAALAVLEATYNQQIASLNLLKTQRSLARATESLAKLNAETFGMDQKESVVAEEITRLMAENAKLQGERDSLASGARNALGKTAKFLTFGLWDNAWANERDHYDAAITANTAMIESWLQSDEAPDWTAEQMDEIRGVLDAAAQQYAAGNEVAAEAAIRGSILGDAVRANEAAAVRKTIDGIDQTIDDLQTSIAEWSLNIDFEAERMAQQSKLDQYRELSASAQNRAAAYRAESDAVKDAYMALADHNEKAAATYAKNASGGADIVIKVDSSKKALTLDEVDAMLEGITENQSGINVRLERLENADSGASAYVAARR